MAAGGCSDGNCRAGGRVRRCHRRRHGRIKDVICQQNYSHALGITSSLAGLPIARSACPPPSEAAARFVACDSGEDAQTGAQASSDPQAYWHQSQRGSVLQLPAQSNYPLNAEYIQNPDVQNPMKWAKRSGTGGGRAEGGAQATGENGKTLRRMTAARLNPVAASRVPHHLAIPCRRYRACQMLVS